MIATLLGLILMLGNLDSPDTIGPSMAVALIGTLYGAVMANLVCIPLGEKLSYLSHEELLVKQIIIKGILAIQAGDNPADRPPEARHVRAAEAKAAGAWKRRREHHVRQAGRKARRRPGMDGLVCRHDHDHDVVLRHHVRLGLEPGGEGKEASPEQQAAIESLQYRFGPSMEAFRQLGSCRRAIRPAQRRRAKPPGGIARPPSDPAGDVKVLKKEQARIRIPGRGDRVVIGGIVFYDDASLALADAQKARLKVIAGELVGKPQEVEVLGHASPRPLPAGSAYRDRWDLAYARCRQTVAALASMQIDPRRLRIAVVEGSGSVGSGSQPGEDAQVDVYLTDVLPPQPANAVKAGP